MSGILDIKQGIIDAPISRKSNSIIERCINENGDKSISHYEVLSIDNTNNFSVVKFVLETGRTHQIRVHSQFIGHPILGDTLYGCSSNLISRQALHCYKMSFIHPVTKNKVFLTCPIPIDMRKLYI